MPQPIPREPVADATLALLAEGYRYISRRCEQLDSDVFRTRLMLRPAVCVMGGDAARMFYTPGRFVRKHALPPNTLVLLQDLGSVQLREGAEHLLRKQLFMSFMREDSVLDLVRHSAAAWRERFADWERRPSVVLQQEAEAVLCRAVCAWAGLPLDAREADARTAEFAAMIDGAGAVGPRNWRGMLRRARTERWARHIIEAVRGGSLRLADGCAAQAIARFAGSDGHLLDSKIAAVELLNLLRPTVAVARYVTFAALAMHAFPACRRRLASGDEDYLDMFVQEVRRYYPFFPAVGGIVSKPFDWRGIHFEAGSWVLLDLYGTNHDARLWPDPFRFDPQRFAGWRGGAHALVPQGAGDFFHGHRCPGEWFTVELVKTAVRQLLHEVSYEVPRQDLRVDLARMPALPASGFVLSKVRRLERH